MIPKLKRTAMFKRSPRSSQGSYETAQPVEGISLPDSMPDTELLDMDLFTKDFDLWYARAIVQCYVAISIQKEHLGHAAINPKTILEHVEARYWSEPSQNVGSNVGPHNPGSELFSRIKAARATKNDKTLEVFLDQLFLDIQTSCRELRNEQAAELDAPFRPKHINRAATPSSTTSSNPNSEDSGEATDTSTETERPLPDDVVPSLSLSVQSGLPLPQPLNTTDIAIKTERPLADNFVSSPSLAVQDSHLLRQLPNTTDTAIKTERPLADNVVPSPSLAVQGGLPLPQPLQTEQSLHRYTSMLYEYASVSGTQPEYNKEWVSMDIWRCEAIFNGIHGVGEARSWKNARHIASQKICETLGITED